MMQAKIKQENKAKPKELREIDKGSASDKSGFSVFCGATGCGFVIPKANGRCPSCNEKIIRESTYDSAVKLFLSVIEKNRNVFNSHVYSDFEINTLKILVNIGKPRYWVPFRYFVELENIERTDRSQLENFFEYIKSHCDIYKEP